jgi:proline dehydrogenase
MAAELKAVDFSNTKVAFEAKSDKDLLETARLFKLMNNSTLVNLGSKLTLAAIKLRVPFVETAIEKTIFKQFCGGTHLMDSQSTIDLLYQHGVATILDYGAEGKETEEEFDQVMEENLKAIDFAASNESVPVISTKVSGLASNAILQKVQEGSDLAELETARHQALKKRLHKICSHARDRNVGIFIDAEETWIQDTIDSLVYELMEEYNRETIIVYNTYQMYRKDMLDHLTRDFEVARSKGYILGAKLVRGAYMEKERERALELGYESPINNTKAETDELYNNGIRFCVSHYEQIASANASHNLKSNQLQAELIHQKGIVKDHTHLNFCQLLGMSDHLTFNLAKEGYNVAKYVPYGPVKDVIPYLIRRAQENSSVTGEMGREYALISEELRRRGLA